MFEAAELGRQLDDDAFDRGELELRVKLLEAQRALRAAGLPVIVVIGGVEGAGKSEVVNRLTEWLDTRGLETHTFWEETGAEAQRPLYWRFWRRLPPRGTVGIVFGSWYTRPIIDHALGKADDGAFEAELHRVVRFEDTLTQDGALLVKLWFHLSKEEQQRRIERSKKREKAARKAEGKKAKQVDHGRRWKVSPLTKRFSKRYDELARTSERALRRTDTGGAPWHVVEATDPNYRDLTAGRTLLDAIVQRLSAGDASCEAATAPGTPEPPLAVAGQPTILDQVDLSSSLRKKEYAAELGELQARLYDATWAAYRRERSMVLAFEGWDASGKGGAIRRLTAGIDARLFRTIPIAAPSDEERARHYLWRFWRTLPRDGHVRIYDRSWYGRVLVERVEGFASRGEWARAYREINEFEEQLVEHGVVLAKLWLHISPEEQLRRFQAREETPHKRHKITPDDWRNREQWDAYGEAVNEMVARTSTAHAPWTIVPGDDKRFARIHVLRTVVERLEAALADESGA